MPPKKAAAPAAKKAAAPAAKKAGAPAAKKAPAKAGAAKAGGAAAAAAAAPAPVVAKPMGETIGLKAMATYLFGAENELKQSGRWPVVSDEAERATTFLRYRDVNLLNVMNEPDMGPERVRQALIGGLRYGKPMVFDMMTTDMRLMYPKVVGALDAVKPGLMKDILSKEILKEACYMQLVKPEDGPDYKDYLFDEKCLSQFSFVLATGTNVYPDEVIADYFIVTIE